MSRGRARCPYCGKTLALRQDGDLRVHGAVGERCPGSGGLVVDLPPGHWALDPSTRVQVWVETDSGLSA